MVDYSAPHAHRLQGTWGLFLRQYLLLSNRRPFAYNQLMPATSSPPRESLSEFKFFAWKCCVTCNNWRGTRVSSENREKVYYQSADMTSTCHGGGWSGVERRPSDACSQWLRWTELK